MIFESFLKLFILLISIQVVFIEVERYADVDFGDSEFAKFIGDVNYRWVFLVEINIEVLLFNDGSNVSEIGAELKSDSADVLEEIDRRVLDDNTEIWSSNRLVIDHFFILNLEVLEQIDEKRPNNYNNHNQYSTNSSINNDPLLVLDVVQLNRAIWENGVIAESDIIQPR